MTLIESLILGVVEGITEYLPVSSTAHIILAAEAMGLKNDDFLKAFNIIIQIAPIFSVMLIYKDKLMQSLELWKKLIISFIPTGVVGLLFHEQIEALFSSNLTVTMMMITGILFLAIEYTHQEEHKHTSDLDEVSYKQAIYIGLFQVFALIPGVSRSGSTILGAMLVGLKREVAMSFSFLLAIPTMGAASSYTLLKEYKIFNSDQFLALGIGFIASFIVGYIAVKTFLKLVSMYSFKPFGYYLLLSGIAFYFVL